MRKIKINHRTGFTLIELMMVVAIIGILAAISMPKFANLMRKSYEGATKANLGSLRSSLYIYYADNEGLFPVAKLNNSFWDNIFDINSAWACVTVDTPPSGPTGLDVLIQGGKYLSDLPNCFPAYYHSKNNTYTSYSTGDTLVDNGYWGYYKSGSLLGSVFVNCTHTDSKGSIWSSY